MSAELRRPLRVAVYSSDALELACPQLRFALPAAALGSTLELEWATEAVGSQISVDLSALERADVVAIARFFPQEATWHFVERIFAAGLPVVYELDDLLCDVPESNPFCATARQIRPYVLRLLARATAITTTSEPLARELGVYSRNVHVLPNRLDPSPFFAPVRQHDGPLRIAYAGTDTHARDLGGIESALVRVAERYGERVRFLFFGCSNERLARLPGAEVLPFESRYAAYAERLRTAEIDLLLAPLEDTRFNRCKSAVKWLECSAAGVPGVWADLAPYREVVEPGETGLLCPPEPEAWYDAICGLVEDSPRRVRLARGAQSTVLSQHTPSRAGGRFLEVYGALAAARGSVAAKPRCSIIVPVWNRADLTGRCIERVLETTEAESCELIVVDDGSTDETPALLERFGSRLRALRSPSNEGFGRACNRGAEAARGEYLVFLNNDTLPQPGWLAALRAAADEDAGTGIAGSLLLYPNGRVQHAGIAISRRFRAPYGFWRGLPRDAPMVSRRRDLQAVTGACMLVRAELFRELGGFDLRYHNGFEDVDLCLRAAERGWRVLYEPASVVYHLESQTPGRKQHDLANLERFGARWGRPSRVDEDRIYFEDDFWIRVEVERGARVLRYFPLENDAARERWSLVAEVQRRCTRSGLSTALPLLEHPGRWPDDRDVLLWGADLCEEAGLGELASAFRARASASAANGEAAHAVGRAVFSTVPPIDWLARGIETQLAWTAGGR